MTTTIDNNQRIFVVSEMFNSGNNPVLCNINDLETVCRAMPKGVQSIKHFWNGKVNRLSRKDIKATLEAHKLNSNFPPLKN